MDEPWKTFLEFCTERNVGPFFTDYHAEAKPCMTTLKGLQSIRTDLEFTCPRRDNPALRSARLEDTLSAVGIIPKLRMKRYQRPPTTDEDLCNDIELPFPVDEYEFLCNEIPDPIWGSTFCIQRIFLLLHITPEISDIETRIGDLWKFFERKSPNGVFVKDIRLLLGVVFSLSSHKEQGGENNFRQNFLAKALAQLKRGIRVQKLSDKEDLSGLTGALSDFGEIIRQNDPDLISGGIEILETWLETFSEISKKSAFPETICEEFDDYALGRSAFVNCVEKSHLGKRLLQKMSNILDANPLTDSIFLQLTALLAQLIELSEIIRFLTLKNSPLEAILLKLKNPDKGNHLLSHTIEVIYGLFAKPLDQGVIDQLLPLNPEAFHVLLFRFLQRMKYIRSKAEMSLRNDVGFAVYLLTKYFSNIRTAFGHHGLVLAGIIKNNIIKKNDKDIIIVIDSTSDDLELLKFLIWILQLIFEADPLAIEIVKKFQLVTVMIRILIGPCHILELLPDNDPSFEPLIKVTSQTLHTMAKRFPIIFQQPEGIDSMLKVLELYSVFGTLDLGIVDIFLDTLRVLLANEGEVDGMMAYFVERNAMKVFTDVLKEFSKRQWTMSDEPSMCNILICCSILGKYDESQREIFAEGGGVKVLIRLINLLVYSYTSQRHINPILHICVAEVVWQCLAESPSALETFLAYEGIFRILDLLEIAAGPAAQLHLLGCILELSEYPRCIDQLMYWRRRNNNLTKRFNQGDEFDFPGSRGPNVSDAAIVGDEIGDSVLDRDVSLSALFCELWRNEEKNLKVLRETNGVIASLDKPLMSEFSRNFEKKIFNTSEFNGPSCLDLISSIRPKIYLLMKKIIETSNTEAVVYGGLSLPNQLTMQIIINFLDLKRGEIWREMVEELENEETKLVDSDEIAVGRFLKIAKNKVCAVIDTQRYLINRVEEHDEMNERTLYNTIQMCYLQDHLEALKEAEFFARTSNYFLLVDKRLWQKAQLQQVAWTFANVNARIHRTTEDSLNITNWPGRTKMIESEPKFAMDDFNEAQAEAEANKYLTATATTTTTTAEPAVVVDQDSGKGRVIFKNEEENDDFEEQVGKRQQRLVPTSAVPNTEFASAEEGFSQVAPQSLKKALLMLLSEEKKWKWRGAEGENAWRMRSKWRSNWYSGA